ncbi:MAG: YhgE/Pip domain-containing protein [Actinomycetaceae bacterium]|nr:YhgE/Pip domain-containing protein [Actinomycetaceae bacterium]MDY6082904.1 YhgE/Pip domain-containing protein [Actinomycetaceae bacterium]
MKPFWRRHWLMSIIVVLIPAIISLVALNARAFQTTSEARPAAAIVNNDEPVTLSTGQMLPAGRQMIAELTDPDRDSQFEWNVVTSSTAAAGLRNGTYAASLTVPPEFSRRVASVLEGKDTAPGVLTLRTNGQSSLANDLSKDIVQAASKDLGTSFTVSYLTQALSATSTIKDGMDKAADGAQQVADGASESALGSGRLADGTQQATDGTTQLAAGAAALASGTQRGADAATQLSSSLPRLTEGTRQLSRGILQYTGGVLATNDGAQQLADGTRQLDNGIAQYIQAVAQANDGIRPLSTGAHSLADGVKAYTDGVHQLYAGLTEPQAGQRTSMVEGAHQLADALGVASTLVNKSIDGLNAFDPSGLQDAAAASDAASSGFEELTRLIDLCAQGNQTACAQAQSGTRQSASLLATLRKNLHQAADAATQSAQGIAGLKGLAAPITQLTRGASGLASGLDTISEQMKTNMLGSAAQQLTHGSAGLAEGIDKLGSGLDRLTSTGSDLDNAAARLAGGARKLTTGLGTLAATSDSLASGASQVLDGTQQLTQGAPQLEQGITTLAEKTTQLAQGAARAAEGNKALAHGARELSAGQGQLKDGAAQLADQLSSGARNIPTYSAQDAQRTAAALADPVTTSTHISETNSVTSMAGGIGSIALWLGALGAVVLLGTMNRARMDMPLTPLRLFARSTLSICVLALIQSALLLAVMAGLGVKMHNFAAVGAFVLLSSAAMTAIHMAFFALWGMKGGTIASLVAVGIQGAFAGSILPYATGSGMFAGLRGALPVPQAADGLSSLLTRVGSPTAAIWVLVFWIVVSIAVTIPAISQRRTLSLAQLRARLPHPESAAVA